MSTQLIRRFFEVDERELGWRVVLRNPVSTNAAYYVMAKKRKWASMKAE